ncbi:hypothetical protein HMPREF0580_1873 [Mobiluncus mulieris ATCC 35239]|uniref:Uncharacterized protein n=1 Tax=Mobiluncus mulieris ATCC 35239 TaxID=871571 RepID=E0QSK8_9ACTO|nr:hypothetical protein HMPREF0580_1873 [Mobiluncus mulieris ATCC 35239]
MWIVIMIHTKRIRLFLLFFEFLGITAGFLGLGSQFIGSLAATGMHFYLLLSSCIVLLFTVILRVLHFPSEQKGKFYRIVVVTSTIPLLAIATLEVTLPLWIPFAYKQKWVSSLRITMTDFIPIALGGIIILMLILLAWKKHSGRLVALSYLISTFAVSSIGYLVLLFCFVGLCMLTFVAFRDALELYSIRRSQELQMQCMTS